MLKLHVIIGSTRPGRVGLPIGEWIYEQAKKNTEFETKLVDLAEINLPFLDEPNHPRFQQYTKEHTKQWSALINEADAYIFVTPEYNFSMPAPLKNAIDYLHHEWKYKPAGITSYGGVSAGTRSAQMLKQVLTGVGIMPIQEGIYMPMIRDHIGEKGEFINTERYEHSVQVQLEQLAIWGKHLKSLREELQQK